MKYHLKIEGMSCASCVKAVEGVLSDVDGVTEVLVNFAAGTARVETEREIDPQLLLNAVKKTGYTPSLSDNHHTLKKKA